MAEAIRWTSQASPDSSTPVTMSTGTKTYERLPGSSSHRNRPLADSSCRSRASTSCCLRSLSRIRSSIRDSRPSEMCGLGTRESGQYGRGLIQGDGAEAVRCGAEAVWRGRTAAPEFFPVARTVFVTFVERRHRAPSRTDRQQGDARGWPCA